VYLGREYSCFSNFSILPVLSTDNLLQMKNLQSLLVRLCCPRFATYIFDLLSAAFFLSNCSPKGRIAGSDKTRKALPVDAEVQVLNCIPIRYGMAGT
jgi:hypothetical protein